MKEVINNSESETLLRSQIKFAGYNPRKISEEASKTLRKGIKTFGLVGGIVVNRRTGYTLVSGHQRITVLDSLKHYPDNDYSLRVEVVDLDDKQEKELNILMNNPNAQGEWDNELLSAILPDIDPSIAGLSDADLAFLGADIIPDGSDDDFSVSSGFVDLSTLADKDGPKTYEEALKYEREKRRLSQEKRKTLEKAQNEANNQFSYICLSFSSFKEKEAFCRRFSIPPMETTISGEEFGEIIERID